MADLICGCRTCGCICPEHSPIRLADPCDRHAAAAVARFVAHEAATLVALALFIGTVEVVAVLWAHLGH